MVQTATKVGFVSLGCPKNLVDTEVMLAMLRDSGFELTREEGLAEVLVVNTCGFIGPAKEESVNTILEMARQKDEGRCRALIVTGCLAQRHADELMQEIPEIDAVVGTGDYPRIAEITRRVLGGERVEEVGHPDGLYPLDLPRVLATPGHTAYLKIAEGCDNCCSYCIIPALRGPYRSRSVESIVSEARGLVSAGVKELVVIAQDTTSYGIDLYGQPALARVLRELATIEGLHWIRVLYSYPTHFTDELIEVLVSEPKICHYLDIPLQHGSDRIIGEMNREGTRAEALDLIRRLRERIPGLALRTSLIVGFPGESENDFVELLSFIEEISFDHVGVFKYSQEEGTLAGSRPDQVPEEEKERRYRLAMERQKSIARAKNRDQIGQTLEVIVEGHLPGKPGTFYGRSYRQAPGIDGVVVFTGGNPAAGDMLRVKIERVRGYDQIGKSVEQL